MTENINSKFGKSYKKTSKVFFFIMLQAEITQISEQQPFKTYPKVQFPKYTLKEHLEVRPSETGHI